MRSGRLCSPVSCPICLPDGGARAGAPWNRHPTLFPSELPRDTARQDVPDLLRPRYGHCAAALLILGIERIDMSGATESLGFRLRIGKGTYSSATVLRRHSRGASSSLSTVIVNGVPSMEVLSVVCGSSDNSLQRVTDNGAHSTPRAFLSMKFTCSGVIFSAATIISPSFSRSSSSTTITILPSRKSSMALSIESSFTVIVDFFSFVYQAVSPVHAR